jgi:hypothetical protein
MNKVLYLTFALLSVVGGADPNQCVQCIVNSKKDDTDWCRADGYQKCCVNANLDDDV